MAKLFSFEVHTPYRLFFNKAVEGIVLTLEDGEIAVFAGHSMFTAPVRTGILKIKDQDIWRSAFVTEGILEVSGHKTILLVDAAEWPGEIDRERALAAKQEAVESIESGMLKFEIENAKAKLRRAEFRLKAEALAGKQSAGPAEHGAKA
jgi:F-type H+-transporting ATPase subunit epsilon